jgi:hypothetical protein
MNHAVLSPFIHLTTQFNLNIETTVAPQTETRESCEEKNNTAKFVASLFACSFDIAIAKSFFDVLSLIFDNNIFN